MSNQDQGKVRINNLCIPARWLYRLLPGVDFVHSVDIRTSLMMDRLAGALSFTNTASLVALWIGYHILVALYNISPFHPLSRFPGPKIAAASYLYEAYYDWILMGRYGHEIRRMHEVYGELDASMMLITSLTSVLQAL